MDSSRLNADSGSVQLARDPATSHLGELLFLNEENPKIIDRENGGVVPSASLRPAA